MAEDDSSLKLEEGISRTDIRKKMWDFLDDRRLLSFPRPPYKLIPNFKGCDDAADRVRELDVFKDSTNVLVHLDRVFNQMRFRTLEAKKVLLWCTSKRKSALLGKITPPADCSKFMLRKCINPVFSQYNSWIGLSERPHIDLMIVTSTAVSITGERVGRDDDMSDVEYAALASLGVVDENTIILTIVHDRQVVDLDLKAKSCPHDFSVDFIVTPERTIKCEGGRGRVRPTGITWSLLTADQLDRVPVLRRLRYADWAASKDVRLQGEAEQPTELVDESANDEVEEKRRKANRAKTGVKSGADGEEGEDANDGAGKSKKVSSRGTSGGRRRHKDSSGDAEIAENGDTSGKENGEGARKEDASGSSPDGDERKRGGPPRRNHRRYVVQKRRPRSRDDLPAVYLGGLPKYLRLHELHEAIRSRNVTPVSVVKPHFSLCAFLKFDTLAAAEAAAEALSGLTLNDRPVKTELAHRSRKAAQGDVEDREVRTDQHDKENDNDVTPVENGTVPETVQ